MRPYLAILKDSFREALSSKVLLVILGLITLVLLAVAPLGYREQKTTALSRESVQTWPRFIEQLRDDVKKEDTSPSHWIMSRLDDGLQDRIREYKNPEPGDPGAAFRMLAIMDNLRDALAKELVKAEFYDRDSWQNVKIADDELKELLARTSSALPQEDIGRRNRLLMEAAYPDLIPASPPTSLRIRYLHWEPFSPLPISKARLQTQIEETVVWLLSWFVGVIGVGIALVITAPIIPQTFDPGSLLLLLSKPIHRWLLFLTKYSGGCAYTCVTAAYFAGGLWLLLGARFSIWNHGILMSIPIFMFLFGINYSVSALAGVLWRSPILCVVLSVVFWLGCSILGTIKSRLDGWYIDKIRISRIINAGDELLVANELGSSYRWDSQKQSWQEILVSESPEQAQMKMARTLTTIPRQLRPFGFVYDTRRSQYLVVEKTMMQQPVLRVGKAETDWRDQEGVGLPFGAHDVLIEPNGDLLVFAQSGLFRLDGDPAIATGGPKLFGFKVPIFSRDPLVNVGPQPPITIGDRAIAAVSRATGKLVVFSRGTITVLAADETRVYQRVLERKLDIESTLDAALAVGSTRLVLGLEDGRIQRYNLESLEMTGEWQWDKSTPPRRITSSADGDQFAVLLHNDTLRFVEGDEEPIRPALSEQGQIGAVSFVGADRLQIAQRSNRVVEYEMPGDAGGNWRVGREFHGSTTGLEKAYYYLIKPVHALLPKPGELTDTLQYFVSGKSTVADDSSQTDLLTTRKRLNPWNPVWSGGLFLLVILGIGCLYMQWSEF